MIKTLLKRFSLIGPQSANDQGKLTVVVDLDETLCHVFYPDEAAGFQYQPDIKEDVILKYKRTYLYVYKRPDLDRFLKFLDENYEPILWSSGVKDYVDIVADFIDPNRIFRHRLYQEHCDYERPYGYPQYEFVKDIKKLRQDTSRVVLIDNNWRGMLKGPDNYLNIPKYEAWFQDDSLVKDVSLNLKEIEKLEDVRPFLRARFMYKYFWASQGLFYKITDNDLKIADFIAKNGVENYDKLKLEYDRLFNPKVPYITTDELW